MRKLQLLSLFVLISTFIYGQESDRTLDQMKQEFLKEKEAKEKTKKKIDSFVKAYESTLRGEKVFNNKTLNILFARELENYVTSSNTPSSRELSASISNDDNSVAVGFTIDNRKGEVSKYLKHLLYVGGKVRGKSTNSFFTLFDSDGLVGNAGIEINYTYMIPGLIFHDKKVNQALKDYRDGKLREEISKEFPDIENAKKEKVESFIAGKEVDYILEKKQRVLLSKAWLGLGGYIPVSKSRYSLTPTSNIYNPMEVRTNNWDFNMSANYLQSWIKGSFTFTLRYRVYNNNNILSEILKEQTFVQFAGDPTVGFAQREEKKAYVGELEEFNTQQFQAEFTSLLYKNMVGISASVDRNYGTYNRTNWKLGVPLSFKDKEGKNTVNFEIQWREVNANHFIGISIGKSFGKFVD